MSYYPVLVNICYFLTTYGILSSIIIIKHFLKATGQHSITTYKPNYIFNLIFNAPAD